MKRESSAQAAFFNPRALFGFFLCFVGVILALFAFGAFTGRSAEAQGTSQNQTDGAAAQERGRGPIVKPVVEPIRMNHDLRDLPQVPDTSAGFIRPLLRRHSFSYPTLAQAEATTSGSGTDLPEMNMPGLNISFDGIDLSASGCNCSP